MNKMEYSHQYDRYSAELPDGRTIYVGGGQFIEAVFDRRNAFAEERYKCPVDQISEEILADLQDEAENELLDPEEWEIGALEADTWDELEDIPHYGSYAAYIIGAAMEEVC